jgi:ribonuclease P protein component
MPNHHFPKTLRLLRPSEFDRVFAARLSAGDDWIVVYGANNGIEHPRLGLTVSRKVGGSAARNRWKRLLREAFRLSQHQLPALDLVCSPRASQPPALEQLRESLSSLAKRIERKAEKQPRMA